MMSVCGASAQESISIRLFGAGNFHCNGREFAQLVCPTSVKLLAMWTHLRTTWAHDFALLAELT